MKKCPYCAEEINEDAIKCRYCSMFLDGREQDTKVTKNTSGGQLFWIIVAAIVVGGLLLVIG